MLKIRVLLLLTCAATILFAATALAEGQAGCSFSGTVSLDDAQVAGGTRITAVIEGDEYNTHTAISTPSKYFITVRATEGKTYPDGAKVTFKVNGYTAKQKGVFKAGTSQKLDLTASTTSALQGVSQSSWGIVGLAIALVAAGGAAYYFLALRQRQPRPVRVSAVSAVKRYLPGILQGRISGKTSAYDPSARYIWDKSKLAWVDNPKAAVMQSPMGITPKENKIEMPPAVTKTSASGQPVPSRKYVWDGSMLAWVENHKPPEAASSEEALQVSEVEKAPKERKTSKAEKPSSAGSSVAKYPRRDL